MAFSYYGYELIKESDLSHHGILGMKWGVRRYQNKDGTLTNAGKKHYSKAFQDAENKQHARDMKRPLGDYDGYKLNHPFVTGLRKDMGDYLRKTAEYKEYTKAQNEFEDYDLSLQQKLKDRGIFGDRMIETIVNDKKFKQLEERTAVAEAKYNKKIGEVYLANKDAMVGAKLRDLGFADTQESRELYYKYHLEKFPWDTKFRLIN